MRKPEGRIEGEKTSAKDADRETAVADDAPPNYTLWLNKPCWYKKEICYLAKGLDPASMPRGMIVDVESGENMPAPINYMAVVIAAELYDLIERAIEAGELQPIAVGSNCFKPLAVITYLNQRGVTLPVELLAALPGSVEINPINMAVSVAPVQAEIEPMADKNAEVSSEIWDLFDPIRKAAIVALFDSVNKAQWKKYFDRAARNGLSIARQGDTRPFQYNPAKVAEWLINEGLYTRAHANRKLANNLPPRSKDNKHKILEELD